MIDRNFVMRLIQPPSFTGDDEKAHIARMLNGILWVTILGPILYFLIIPAWTVPLDVVYVICGLIVGVSILCKVLMHFGAVDLAPKILIACLCLILSYAAFIGNGVRAAAYIAQIAVISMAAMLLGPRAALGYWAYVVVLGVGLVYAENNSLLLYERHDPALSVLIAICIIYLGTAIFLILVLRDLRATANRYKKVSKEKASTQEALAQSEEQYRTLVENALQGILIYQNDSIVYANPIVARMLDRTPEELKGMEGSILMQLIHPEDRERMYRNIRDRLAGKKVPRNYEFRSVTRTGEVRWIYLSSSVVQYGGQAAIQAAFVDITERKNGEDKIKELNVELEKRVRQRTSELQYTNKELEAFSYSISHDLRAPLRAIDGFSKALLEDYSTGLDETAQNYLERVCHGVEHMNQLIDDMLKLSQVSRGEIDLQEVNLSVVAHRILAHLKSDASERTVEVTIEPNVKTTGDPRLLNIVMDNLLSNAWKYTSKIPNARIELGRRPTSSGSEIFVRDNGAGFDMSLVDKLFAPFQRLHSPTEFDGTGIGLATVHRIIHRHGGHIRAEGVPGNGAVFSFTLP